MLWAALRILFGAVAMCAFEVARFVVFSCRGCRQAIPPCTLRGSLTIPRATHCKVAADTANTDYSAADTLHRRCLFSLPLHDPPEKASVGL